MYTWYINIIICISIAATLYLQCDNKSQVWYGNIFGFIILLTGGGKWDIETMHNKISVMILKFGQYDYVIYKECNIIARAS